MKKEIAILGSVLFTLVAIPPLGVILSACFGYTFALTWDPLFAVLIASLAVSEVILCMADKDPAGNRAVTLLLTLVTPLSLLSALLYRSIWVVVSMVFCAGCCCCLTVLREKRLVIKLVSCVLSAVLALLIGFSGFIMLLFGNMSQNTVVRSVEWPNGIYYAQVIDNDQGALGGSTLVDVYKNTGIDAVVFRITAKPQRVYHGDWGEFAYMEIYWKDDHCLVINSVEYRIE